MRGASTMYYGYLFHGETDSTSKIAWQVRSSNDSNIHIYYLLHSRVLSTVEVSRNPATRATRTGFFERPQMAYLTSPALPVVAQAQRTELFGVIFCVNRMLLVSRISDYSRAFLEIRSSEDKLKKKKII